LRCQPHEECREHAKLALLRDLVDESKQSDDPIASCLDDIDER